MADFDHRRKDADLVRERKRTLLPDGRQQNHGGYLFGRGRLLPGRKTRLWSEGQFTDRSSARNFDIHPDGKRFAVLKPTEGTEEVALDHVKLILNWFDEVRRRVASAGQN